MSTPEGGWAEASVADDGTIRVRVGAGEPLDEVVLRSYVVGAAHMALGWVTSESLAVDEHGEVHDLTVRSLGILPAVETPPIEVEIEPEDGPAVNVSDAAFAAVAAAVWLDRGLPATWPCP
jgi:CO/xanthine dehydrogenase Mo-binding subunit